MTINPAVIIAGFVFTSVAVMCIAWVCVTFINARAVRQQEIDYRLHVARQQQIEAARYAAMLAHERNVIEVRR